MRRIDRLLSRGGDKKFARAASILVGGAALAHAITALALPLLSRLYSPEDFSALAVFNGILSMLTVIACLRYDIAVAMPERDDDSVNLLSLAVLIAAIFATVIAVPLLIWPVEIGVLLGQPAIIRYLWLIPVAVFLSATASAMQNWFIRAKSYQLIAVSRVTQSAGTVLIQTGAALLKAGPAGLVIGAIYNTSVGSLVLGYRMYRQRIYHSHSPSWTRICSLARDHGHFPRYSTLEALCNMASIQLPVLMISALVVGPEPGYLLLAITVLQAPMALFGVSIGQVFLSLAPDENRKGNLAVFTMNTTAMLVRSGVGPLIAAGIAAPFLFEFLFGVGWQRAGLLLAWMTPWFIMQFLTSPISMALAVTGHQPRALMLQIFNMVCRTGSVYLAWSAGTDFVAEAYALSGLASYFVYYIVVMRTIGAPIFFLATAFRQNALILSLWAIAALVSIGVTYLIFF